MSGIVISFKLSHPKKHAVSNEVTNEGIETAISDEQFRNAEFGITVNVSGMLILVNDVAFWKM